MLFLEPCLGLDLEEVCPETGPIFGPSPARREEKGPRKRVILYGLTSERRMRSKHPTLLEALELNLSLTVDSSRARLLGSAGIGNA